MIGARQEEPERKTQKTLMHKAKNFLSIAAALAGEQQGAQAIAERQHTPLGQIQINA